MNCKTIVPVLAGVAWLLAMVLVTQLLGGTFDMRSCTTGCMQVLYWTAFAVAIAGLGISGWLIKGGARDLVLIVSAAALLLLVLKFLTLMFIGTFL